MSAKAIIGDREVEFWDYDVEVNVVPETRWVGGWSRIGKRKPSTHPEAPWVRVSFRGKGRYKSDLLPSEPRNIAVSLMLPKADAIRVAHTAMLAATGEDTNDVQTVLLSGPEKRRSWLAWKLTFHGVASRKSDDE
jgi:hypothetical protein